MAKRPSNFSGTEQQKKILRATDNHAGAQVSSPVIAGAFRELTARQPASAKATADRRDSRPICSRLTDGEREQLQDWTRSRTLPHRLVVRSRIILLASDGLGVNEIAARLGVSPATVRLWCERFSQSGVAALSRERPGRGRPRGRSASIVIAVLRAMREHAGHTPRWTTRALGAAAGVSAASVWRIWKHYRVDPTSTVAEIDHAIAQAISETSNGSN